jgi:hypothetical protein
MSPAASARPAARGTGWSYNNPEAHAPRRIARRKTSSFCWTSAKKWREKRFAVLADSLSMPIASYIASSATNSTPRAPATAKDAAKYTEFPRLFSQRKRQLPSSPANNFTQLLGTNGMGSRAAVSIQITASAFRTERPRTRKSTEHSERSTRRRRRKTPCVSVPNADDSVDVGGPHLHPSAVDQTIRERQKRRRPKATRFPSLTLTSLFSLNGEGGKGASASGRTTAAASRSPNAHRLWSKDQSRPYSIWGQGRRRSERTHD